jgi:hypothetical protein
VSYQVNWEIQALDQAAGFLRDDPIGIAALWDTVGQLADEPRHVVVTRCRGPVRAHQAVVLGQPAQRGRRPVRLTVPPAVKPGSCDAAWKGAISAIVVSLSATPVTVSSNRADAKYFAALAARLS